MKENKSNQAGERTQSSAYLLNDTFNGRVISRHRSIAAAINARGKHLTAVRRANGKDSYLTYSITRADGQPLDSGELHAEEEKAYKSEHCSFA
jgi:hypothetical protein